MILPSEQAARHHRRLRHQHIIFDCDSTLTAVEGIDVLAEDPGMKSRIAALTRAAMDGNMDLSEVYGDRLALLQPTRRQIHAVRSAYKQHVVEDAADVIAWLTAHGHDVYIVSGGLIDPVRELGIWLGIPRANIRAVEVQYDELSSRWWLPGGDWDTAYMDYRRGPLALSYGKAQVIRDLLQHRPGRRLLVGDGHSDLAASEAVDLFVGFGGVATRPQVRRLASVFIECPSLAAISCLAAGPEVTTRLDRPEDRDLVRKGLSQIKAGQVKFRDPKARSLFLSCPPPE